MIFLCFCDHSCIDVIIIITIITVRVSWGGGGGVGGGGGLEGELVLSNNFLCVVDT